MFPSTHRSAPVDDDDLVSGYAVTLTICTSKPDEVAKITEVLSRAAAGLVLEGMMPVVSWGPAMIVEVSHEESET